MSAIDTWINSLTKFYQKSYVMEDIPDNKISELQNIVNKYCPEYCGSYRETGCSGRTVHIAGDYGVSSQSSTIENCNGCDTTVNCSTAYNGNQDKAQYDKNDKDQFCTCYGGNAY